MTIHIFNDTTVIVVAANQRQGDNYIEALGLEDTHLVSNLMDLVRIDPSWAYDASHVIVLGPPDLYGDNYFLELQEWLRGARAVGAILVFDSLASLFDLD